MTRRTNTPVIAFGVDDNYVEPMLVAFVSLAVSGMVTPDVADVAVLHTSLTLPAQDRILRLADRLGLAAEIIEVEAADATFPVTDWVSDAVYLRLRLGDVLAADARVLYLDCDLVATGDLRPLLDARLTHGFGAVRATPNPVLNGGEALPGWRALALPPDREYFNSGVLLIETEEWRRRDVGRRSAQFIADHPEHIRFWDQDALNYVIDDEWDRLPPENNVLTLSPLMPGLVDIYRGGDHLALDDALALEHNARILHFAGPLKPWADTFPKGHPADVYAAFRARLAELES